MREIIYVQAGTTANYVGTHFWNEQDYYATLEANGDEQERIDHATSFSIREDPNTARIVSLEIPRSTRDRLCSVQILSDRDCCCSRGRVWARHSGTTLETNTGTAGNLGGLIRAQAPATDQDAGSEPLWYAGPSQLQQHLTKNLGVHI